MGTIILPVQTAVLTQPQMVAEAHRPSQRVLINHPAPFNSRSRSPKLSSEQVHVHATQAAFPAPNLPFVTPLLLSY